MVGVAFGSSSSRQYAWDWASMPTTRIEVVKRIHRCSRPDRVTGW